MKTKLFKCALSFALASALVFVSALMCYSEISHLAYADNVTVSDILDTAYGDWSEVPADLQSVASAYFDLYMACTTSDTRGKIKAFTDLELSWLKTLKDGTAVLSPVSGIYYTLNDGELYVNYADNGHGGGGGVRPSERATSVIIPSEDFKEAVEEANTNNAPKGKGLWKCSYRSDNIIHANYDSDMITIWGSADGDCFTDELYIYPFYTDYNGITYYGEYQYRIYYDMYINGNITDYALYFEVYKYLDGAGFVRTSTNIYRLLPGKSMDKPYTICLGNPYYNGSGTAYLKSGYYYSVSDYYNNSCYCPAKQGNGLYPLGSETTSFSSGSDTLNIIGYTASFSKKYSDFSYYKDGSDVSAPERTDIDIGYICSNELISRTYTDVDISKIPDNYYVTISGDTIYDYSITNPETGQSDTINYYITNNYTLPDNGGSGSSGGSVGGDVTVGGQIDVSGSVGVDVNVNINNGGNGGENIGDYIDGSGADVDVGGLLGKLPSLSKGFVD